MNIWTRRAAAALLAVMLCLPIASFAGEQERNRERGPVERAIKIIKKLIGGIATNDDLPQPPPPTKP